jgi:peroxiredoxin
VSIVAASFNTPSQNNAWVVDQSFQYEVWSDTNKTLALHFGAARSAASFTPSRVTLILNAAGGLEVIYNPVSNIGNHPAAVLDDCRTLFGSP